MQPCEVITDKSQLQSGDIVQVTVYDRQDGLVFDYFFVLVAYNPYTEICSKYDMSEYTMEGESRLKSKQPFEGVPLEENGDKRVFIQAFRRK